MSKLQKLIRTDKIDFNDVKTNFNEATVPALAELSKAQPKLVLWIIDVIAEPHFLHAFVISQSYGQTFYQIILNFQPKNFSIKCAG